MIDDKALISAIRSGNKDAFEELVLLHRAGALAFARRYINDWHAAEDIVQDCFAYLFVHIDRYNDKYSFKTYLYTIIRNRSIDFVRKNERIVCSDHVEITESRNPETLFISNEDNLVIRKCIEKLNEDYQTIIGLIDFEGFTYKESALIMDKSLVQIKVLIFRARKRLKVLLEAEEI